MHEKYEAIFDGVSFHPNKPVELEPNTRVTITVDRVEEIPKKASRSWLEVALSLDLDGPSDFSSNLDDYLYRGKELP